MQEDLSSGELAQQEMNTLSLQLYQLWDNELNSDLEPFKRDFG